jgi:hypothetical protein
MPLEQVSNALVFYFLYIASKAGKTGLSPTVDVYRNSSKIVTAGNASEVGGGCYSYTLASGSNTVEGEYIAIAHTADSTVDQQDVAAIWCVGKAGIEDLDAAITTRLAPATPGRTLVVDAAGLADANVVKLGPTGAGTAQTARDVGATLGVAGAGLTALGDTRIANLDAAISTRSTYAGGAVASVTGAVGSVVGLTPANLDVAVSTRSTLTAADVWGYATRTLTSLSALVASIAAAVWAYVTRTLTQPAATVSAAVDAGTITIKRGDSLSASLTGLGNITTRSKLWFAVKRSYNDADTVAVVMIEETSGLLYLNSAPAVTAGNGDITIDDATAGDITIVLNEVETAKLTPVTGMVYDVQMLTATGVRTLCAGDAIVTADVVRATS